jgi:hypothetical protein
MKSSHARLLIALVATLPFFTASLSAQTTQTWVSVSGNDNNNCSRDSPCRSFNAAVAKTSAYGEVDVLDSGVYAGVGFTLTKPVTIHAEGVTASILTAVSDGILVNIGATDRVVLEGLDIEGLATTGNAQNGIKVVSAGDVIVRKCTIRDFTSFQGAGGAGVEIDPTASTRVTIDQTAISGNLVGVELDGPGGLAHAKILNSVIVANRNAGVQVTGAGNDALIGNVQVLASPKALSLISGGAVKSYGNNILSAGDAPTEMKLQ